jgi:pyruvate dehydrogenase E2 component (dihydrolipoamide acetyltransferase)
MSTPTKLTLPMPRLGETMDEGTIAEWLVQPGQSFKRGDPLLEVETDKTMVEYPALGSGTLLETLVAQGDVIEVGTPIAVIETSDAWDGIEAEAEPEATPEIEENMPARMVSTPEKPDTERLRATPLARRIAEQNGIELESLSGTGRRGRIEADDVRAAISVTSSPAKLAKRTASDCALCVHGFAGLGSNWAALRARLQRVGIKATAPDLPGHGANETDATHVDVLVDWLAKDLADVAEPVHLIGHSLGAHLAAQAAQRHPAKVARLTLIAPAGCGLEFNGAFTRGMSSAPNPGELAHLMRILGLKAEELDPQALSTMAESLSTDRLSALAKDMVRNDVQRIDTIAPLKALAGKLPITAIFGLQDQIIPCAHVFNLPPHVACHMVNAGHMPHWDAVEAVADIIAAA